jgi:hypothetical protein
MIFSSALLDSDNLATQSEPTRVQPAVWCRVLPQPLALIYSIEQNRIANGETATRPDVSASAVAVRCS